MNLLLAALASVLALWLLGTRTNDLSGPNDGTPRLRARARRRAHYAHAAAGTRRRDEVAGRSAPR